MTINMTVTNADLVREGYAAFNAGDGEALTRLFSENASWETPGSTSIAGKAIGRDAVFARFGRYGGETNGTFQADVIDVLTGSDGRVVGLHRNTGQRNGKTLDTGCCIVFEIEGGQLVSGKEYFFDLANWDDFWS